MRVNDKIEITDIKLARRCGVQAKEGDRGVVTSISNNDYSVSIVMDKCNKLWIIPVKALKVLGCKSCSFRKHCGGFRDREGRCPKNMAGDSRRWKSKEKGAKDDRDQATKGQPTSNTKARALRSNRETQS